jgi:hypothetical protein
MDARRVLVQLVRRAIQTSSYRALVAWPVRKAARPAVVLLPVRHAITASSYQGALVPGVELSVLNAHLRPARPATQALLPTDPCRDPLRRRARRALATAPPVKRRPPRVISARRVTGQPREGPVGRVPRTV